MKYWKLFTAKGKGILVLNCDNKLKKKVALSFDHLNLIPLTI